MEVIPTGKLERVPTLYVHLKNSHGISFYPVAGSDCFLLVPRQQRTIARIRHSPENLVSDSDLICIWYSHCMKLC